MLVTGSDGYIGAVLCPMLEAAGHDVRGLDAGWFRGCDFSQSPASPETTWGDVRDVGTEVMSGVDAVVHLAALSNDPLGNVDSDLTYDINERASIRLAEMARSVGVRRFVFASSCSLYGAGGDELLDEDAAFNPVTPYGESKVRAEHALSQLADDGFSPTYMRNATAFGSSPRLRMDLLINDIVARAVCERRIVLTSDGSPWRPFVHVEDIAAAVLTVLAVDDVGRVHDRAFNVGSTEENFQVRAVAEMVADAVGGVSTSFGPGASGDRRDYKVSFDRIANELPEFRPRFTVASGIRQLIAAFEAERLPIETLFSERFIRLQRVTSLQKEGRLDESVRWSGAPTS